MTPSFHSSPALASVFLIVGIMSGSLRAQSQFWDHGFVLQTNDRVLEGQIEQQNEFIRIKLNEGSEVRLPHKKVRAIGNSLNELYQFKKKSLPQFARGGDHADLARWCLSVNLLTEAGEHFLILAKEHPPQKFHSVNALGIEIKDRMLQQNDFRASLGMAPIQRTQPTAALTSAQAQASVLPAAASGNTAVAIHPRAHQRFAEQVQHILVNRCGQAACHGQGTKTSFQLLEVGGRDAAQQTQKNMEMVLNYISSDPQAKSALIDYMTRSHGPMRSPAIAARESNLIQEVINWVQFVQQPVVTADAAVQPSILNPLAPSAPQLRQVPRDGIESIGPNQFPEGLDLPTAAEIDALDQQLKTQPGSVDRTSLQETPSGNPADPFDPAEFNRQTVQSRR